MIASQVHPFPFVLRSSYGFCNLLKWHIDWIIHAPQKESLWRNIGHCDPLHESNAGVNTRSSYSASYILRWPDAEFNTPGLLFNCVWLKYQRARHNGFKCRQRYIITDHGWGKMAFYSDYHTNTRHHSVLHWFCIRAGRLHFLFTYRQTTGSLPTKRIIDKLPLVRQLVFKNSSRLNLTVMIKYKSILTLWRCRRHTFNC